VEWHVIGLAPLVLPRTTGAVMDPASAATSLPWLWIRLTLLAKAWMLGHPWCAAPRRLAGLPQLPRICAAFVEAFFALFAPLSAFVVL